MKTNYLLGFALLAMSMAGCSQSEVIDSGVPTDQRVIGFATYANQTKGTPIADNAAFAVNGREFGVAAFLGAQTTPYVGTAAKGAQIHYGTAWDYQLPSEIRFWPSAGVMQFYAYTPFTDAARGAVPAFANPVGGASSMTFNDYTVPTDAAQQQDFMFAFTNVADVSTASGSPVALNFKHALTQIHFAARTEADNMHVAIAKDGISLCNVNPKSLFTVKDGAGMWSIPTPTAAELVDYVVPSDEILTIGYHATDYTKLDNAAKSYVMLIPQSTTAWATTGAITTSTTGSYISINCKIWIENGTDQVYLHGTAAAYATLYMPLAYVWTAAQNLTYNLTFGGGYDVNGKPILKPITYTTTITEGWATATSSDVVL
ncbi:MAG: fimbrillin family protein [Alistipes sp.]